MPACSGSCIRRSSGATPTTVPNANWAGFKSDEYSQLADGLLKETDPAKQKQVYAQWIGLHPGPVVGDAVVEHGAAHRDDGQGAGPGVQHDRVPHAQRRLFVLERRSERLMATFLFRRCLEAIPVILLATVIIFLGMRLIPGDPALVLARAGCLTRDPG